MNHNFTNVNRMHYKIFCVLNLYFFTINLWEKEKKNKKEEELWLHIAFINEFLLSKKRKRRRWIRRNFEENYRFWSTRPISYMGQRPSYYFGLKGRHIVPKMKLKIKAHLTCLPATKEKYFQYNERSGFSVYYFYCISLNKQNIFLILEYTLLWCNNLFI